MNFDNAPVVNGYKQVSRGQFRLMLWNLEQRLASPKTAEHFDILNFFNGPYYVGLNSLTKVKYREALVKDCGTTACIWGHLVAQTPDISRLNSTNWNSVPDPRVFVSKHTDLDYAQKLYFIRLCWYRDNVFWGDYPDAKQVTNRMAADAVRWYRKNDFTLPTTYADLVLQGGKHYA